MTEPLSGILGEIESVAGLPAMLKLVDVAGGTRVYIPAEASDRHWLVRCVGREAADKLMRHFAVDSRRGQRVDIPVFAGTYRQLIRKIAERLDKADRSESSAQLARALGIAQRTVHRHRAKRRGMRDSRQAKLF
jgi:hypothetical protein